MSSEATGRDDRIDALRGFALLGILLVNIQSYAWGGTSPAGYLRDGSPPLDHAVFFLTVTFANLKFMPLFAMLFGVGFALLLARLDRITSAPHAVFRRRMLFLFAFGLAHGVFLYYGDITNGYALAGVVLLLHSHCSVRSLKRVLAMWWTGALALAALFAWGGLANPPDPLDLAAELEANFSIFTEAGYVEQLPRRVALFIDIALANLVSLPLTVALMVTGMLAQRAGWLADPRAPAWRTALIVGLVAGLPAALLYGYLQYVEADAQGLGAYSALATFPGVLSIALSFAYAAAFFMYARGSVVRWLASAGRMPLTNYLLQSVAMGALLSGWGLALAPALGYAETALLAVAVFGMQVVVSRWWLQRYSQGPLERLWRLWTYHRMPPPRTTVRIEE